MRGAARRETAALRHALFGAWKTASFSRAKRLPRLESEMRRLHQDAKRKPAKTPEQWLSEFEKMASHFGGEPLKKPPKLKAAFLAQIRERD